jgi:hypothetical protein
MVTWDDSAADFPKVSDHSSARRPWASHGDADDPTDPANTGIHFRHPPFRREFTVDAAAFWRFYAALTADPVNQAAPATADDPQSRRLSCVT